ncbi:hypothetical protein M9Y10_022317 [Tritrichomonas musculus]|uniref:Uncharacterized protein n=1 Tax=Tritrichomonas musculus TaxID=1915356 RepID=A0ABR2KRX2_9EUKA
MSGIISDVRIFYPDSAPEFVVIERHMDSGIAYYRNNGRIELRDRVDNHLIEEEEMTQETIDYLKQRFEENKRSFEQTELNCAKVSALHKKTICKK